MKFIVKPGDVVILDDEKQYRVMNCVELDGHGYLVIKRMKITLESALSIEKSTTEIVEEVLDENMNYYFSLVTDEKIINAVNNIVANEKLV